MIKVYSPNQIAVSAFFGGPFAAVYVLMKNFAAMDKKQDAKRVLLWGCFLIVVLLLSLPFLPDKFPPSIIPIAYMIGTRTYAEQKQLTKQAIESSGLYAFKSAKNIFVVCVISLIAFFTIGFILVFVLTTLGVKFN